MTKITTKQIIGILTGIIILLVISVVYLLSKNASEGSVKSATTQSITSVSTTAEPSLTKSSPTPTDKPKNNVGRNIENVEEALEEVRTLAKPYTVDIVKVANYKAIYTPSSKQWSFQVYTRLNPVQANDYTAPEYDYKWIEITIDNEGYYSMNVYDQPFMFKRHWDQYLDSQEIKEEDITRMIDSAKTHIETTGTEPGIVYIVDNQNCGSVASCLKDVYVTIVNKGEEKNDPKEAKKVYFKDGSFYKIEDVEITLTTER